MKHFLGFDRVKRGFDPLLYLGITNIKDEEKNIVYQKILDIPLCFQIANKYNT